MNSNSEVPLIEDDILRIVAMHQPLKMMKIVARLMLEKDEVVTYDVQRGVSKLLQRGVLIQDDQFCYRTNKPTVTITIRVGGVEGTVTRTLLAELPSDNEENIARLADQLSRAAVRRHYALPAS